MVEERRRPPTIDSRTAHRNHEGHRPSGVTGSTALTSVEFDADLTGMGRAFPPVIETFRVTFLGDDPAERQRLATALRGVTIGDARIVAAFADAKTVEVYLDIGDAVVSRRITDQLAHQLGVNEYEVARVEPLPTEPIVNEDAADRGHLRPATITQVRVHPDGRTLSVQARHRPDKTVERLEIEETDETVAITVLVSAPDDAPDQYVSFAVAFTWVNTLLNSPVNDRRIIRHDRDPGPLPSWAFQRGSPI